MRARSSLASAWLSRLSSWSPGAHCRGCRMCSRRQARLQSPYRSSPLPLRTAAASGARARDLRNRIILYHMWCDVNLAQRDDMALHLIVLVFADCDPAAQAFDGCFEHPPKLFCVMFGAINCFTPWTICFSSKNWERASIPCQRVQQGSSPVALIPITQTPRLYFSTVSTVSIVCGRAE